MKGTDNRCGGIKAFWRAVWEKDESDSQPEILKLEREYIPDEHAILKHRRDHDRMIEKTYDIEHNRIYGFFRRFYRVAGLLCAMLIRLVKFINIINALPKNSPPDCFLNGRLQVPLLIYL